MVCTPDGKLSRYLYGVSFDPQTVKLSLAEAADGRIGTPLDQLILYCYRYNSSSGQYTPAAEKIMRLGALVTLLGLGMLILRWRLRSRSGGDEQRLPVKGDRGRASLSSKPQVSNQ